MFRTFISAIMVTAALGCSGSSRQAVSYVYHADPDPVSGQPAHITAGAVPDGDSFTGSYHSQQIGDLYLEQTGEIVIGTYEYDRASCHARGNIEGRANGNLMRFSWTENQRECGRLGLLTGHGYLLLWRDSDTNGRLNGEWGVAEAETGGGPWSAFRDRVRRQTPPSTSSGSSSSVFEDSNTTPAPGSTPTPPR
jgi:hypothetical protein